MTCLNSIETSYRTELGEFFDAHFGRFEEKLERRLTDTTANLGNRIEQLRANVDLKIEQLRVELHWQSLDSTSSHDLRRRALFAGKPATRRLSVN